MDIVHHQGAYSARVEMNMIVNGATIKITHMGPDFLFIESSDDYPPGEALIILKIDDRERRWKVKLPEGISSRSKRVVLSL